MKTLFFLALGASLAMADASTAQLSSLKLTHRGRGIDLERGAQHVYFSLPAKLVTYDGETRFLASRTGHDGNAFRIDPHMVGLGPSVVGTGQAQADWRSLDIYFESELAERAWQGGDLNRAKGHLDRAIALAALGKTCWDFLNRNQCDAAPLVYRLALVELARGRRNHARALLAPLSEVNGVRLFADLSAVAVLAPLLDLPEVAHLRAPSTGTLAELREARALVSTPAGTAVFCLPEAAAYNGHPGTPSMAVFHSPRVACDGEWYCGEYADDLVLYLDTPSRRERVDTLIAAFGFHADPRAPGIRLVGADLVWDLPSIGTRVSRSEAAHHSGCEGEQEYDLGWESY